MGFADVHSPISHRQLLAKHVQDITHEIGREPTDRELADRSGISLKRMTHVRSYNPAVAEGTLEGASGEVFGGTRGMGLPEAASVWQRLVYEDLSPRDQKIMEHSMGMHGRKPMANQDIARKLGVSPGAISQRKKIIQDMLNKEAELSPFVR